MTKIKTITAALCASLAVGCVLETERFGSYPPVEAGLHPPVEVGEYELAVGMATQWHMADTFPADRAGIEAIDLTTVGVSHHADIQAACGSANPNLGGCYFRSVRSIKIKEANRGSIGILAHEYAHAIVHLAGLHTAGTHGHPAFDGDVEGAYDQRLAEYSGVVPLPAEGSLVRAWEDVSECARIDGGMGTWPNGERLDCAAATAIVAPYYRAMVPADLQQF